MGGDRPPAIASHAPTLVLPPGPFPPSGAEPADAIDLGIRLRDTLYRRDVVLDARAALHGNIRAASRSPQQLLIALPSIDAFIDTWPLAAMIEGALATWRQGPEPRALAVMYRASEVIGSVLGWPRSIDRRWPLPDEAWMRRQVSGPCRVVPRGPRDGAPAAAVALDAPFARAQPLALPTCITAHGDELAARLPDLLAGLRTGVAHAIDVDGWIPWDAASRAAFDAITEATELQGAVRRYGLAALAAGGGPAFDDVLEPAPASEVGERMLRMCDALMVPTLDAEGAMQPVGVLVWDGPHRPIRVNPAAITVLEMFTEARGVSEAARVLDADPAVVHNVVEQLAAVGALRDA